MFRLQRRMKLNALVTEAQAARAARLEEEAMMAALSAAEERLAADCEATTVLNLSEVLSRLDTSRPDQDRTGVQVLGAVGSRRDVVLICPGDPDEEISEIIRGPWHGAKAPVRPTQKADEEISEIIRGPWGDPAALPEPGSLTRAVADEEISEIIKGPWSADEEATCIYNQAELEALLNR